MIRHLPKTVGSCLRFAAFSAVFLLMVGGYRPITAQTEDAFSDGAADPVKLFERGQNAHAHGDLEKAVAYYDEAIKVRPEFAEAEFQRGTALVALGRFAEAEAGFRRTIGLRKDWSLPYAALGSLLLRVNPGSDSLGRVNRDSDAESVLRQAIKLDAQNSLALRLLAGLLLRSGKTKEAVEFARRATSDNDAPASAWLLRALAERANGDTVAALASLDKTLQMNLTNLDALFERAEIRIKAGDEAGAIADLKAAESLIKGEKGGLARLAADYELAGRPDDAQRIGTAAGLTRLPQKSSDGTLKVVGTPGEIEGANSDDPLTARTALEALLKKNPDNAMLLARLGAAYRTSDPSRSLDYYKRAVTIEPANADYATGYSSALVQARRFAEAAGILRRVIAVAPNNYTAHANLATALYELRQFAPALDEYEWLLEAKPDLSVAYYFIATSHDYLGEYEQALAAYESFLARADAQTNQLEIEKVKLRLPSLRRQIQLGQGAKRKPERPTPH
ncbi:MAG TPA: tetratricopeptide repeat protein [Pyrinomonadaceae bacterium]|nr:tetratricopeptide repeat protein [Pyrinomonadaceae bacterium]